MFGEIRQICLLTRLENESFREKKYRFFSFITKAHNNVKVFPFRASPKKQIDNE